MGDNVTLDCNGATILGNYSNNSTAINISANANVIIQNCVISNYTEGIKFYTSGQSLEKITIQNNNFSYNGSFLEEKEAVQ